MTATVDGESISATYNFIPSAGGYQVMAYNSTVKISEFDDGTTASAGTQIPSAEELDDTEEPDDTEVPDDTEEKDNNTKNPPII